MNPHRVLITGAAGNLGRALRERLRGQFPVMRLSDREAVEEAGEGEEVMETELADAAAVDRLLNGVDAVVHLGGQPVEADWQTVLNSNIIGCYNLFEAARKAGAKRVIFASTNHAIGLHRRTRRLDHTSEAMPDSRYGLSKAFGEDLARLYAYKFGVSAKCVRIGSCFPKPADERALSTWQSYDDFARLIHVGLTADFTFEIVYGVSDNPRAWWDNSNAKRLGYKPQDSAEVYASELEGKLCENPMDDLFQGGAFVSPEFTGDVDKIP
ncbi:MAG: NAD-dependent epimerase/dehydratase family protein [Geminicoccaceae bacterium]